MKHDYKIGEIAKLYQIGPDSLRYYEELGILNPRRTSKNYRLYNIHDMWRLNVIRDLRELGFSMPQIKEYLNNRSVHSTEALLKKEIDSIEKKIASLSALKDNLENRLHTLDASLHQPIEIIEEKVFPDRNCHIIHSGYKIDVEMDILIKQLINMNPENLYIIGNNLIGSMIPLKSAYEQNCRDYTDVFMIDKEGSDLIPGGTYLSISYHGDCEQNYIFIPQLLEYAKEHSLILEGPILELLWIDIHQAEDINEHVTELQVRYRNA